MIQGFRLVDEIFAKKDPKLFYNQCDGVTILLACHRMESKNNNFELSENRKTVLTDVYNRLTIQLALSNPDIEDTILNNCLDAVF